MVQLCCHKDRELFSKAHPCEKHTQRYYIHVYIGNLLSKSSSEVLLFSCVKTAQQCVIDVPACFQKEIRCNKDGKWTAEFSMCSGIQGSCPPPPALNSVEYSCDQGTDIGEWTLKVESHRCRWLFCWDCFVFLYYYNCFLLTITTTIDDIVYRILSTYLSYLSRADKEQSMKENLHCIGSVHQSHVSQSSLSLSLSETHKHVHQHPVTNETVVCYFFYLVFSMNIYIRC